MGRCMGEWVGSGQMTNLIKLELIDIIRFVLRFMICGDTPTYGWMGGLMLNH